VPDRAPVIFVQIVTGFGEPDRDGSCLFRVQQTAPKPLLETLDFGFEDAAVFGRHGSSHTFT
jgi:hypothetical protein